jgi:hypothetical protein
MKLLAYLYSLLRGLVRELSDEAAYQRHLQGRPTSGAEWRKFADHRYRRKYQNAKCC